MVQVNVKDIEYCNLFRLLICQYQLFHQLQFSWVKVDCLFDLLQVQILSATLAYIAFSIKLMPENPEEKPTMM